MWAVMNLGSEVVVIVHIVHIRGGGGGAERSVKRGD